MVTNLDGGPRLLDPSELGTKEYWDAAYTRELQNNTEDAEDEGVVWFDESNAENTVVRKLDSYADQGRLNRTSCRILDLGTGNGHMLFALRQNGDDDDEVGKCWEGEMVGVDYSATSVKLARQLNTRRQDACASHEGDTIIGGHLNSIQFEQWDLLTDPPGDWLEDGFDVILDKGTFDAISLMPHDFTSPDTARNPCETYRNKVTPLLKHGKYFFITSCNWTKSELVEWLAPEGGELAILDEANYPTFTFGGQTGQSVVTVVFQRKLDV